MKRNTEYYKLKNKEKPKRERENRKQRKIFFTSINKASSKILRMLFLKIGMNKQRITLSTDYN